MYSDMGNLTNITFNGGDIDKYMVLFTQKVTFLSKMNILCRMELDIFKKNRHSEVFGTKNRIMNK